jgi:hypothetical protein
LVFGSNGRRFAVFFAAFFAAAGEAFLAAFLAEGEALFAAFLTGGEIFFAVFFAAFFVAMLRSSEKVNTTRPEFRCPVYDNAPLPDSSEVAENLMV